MAISKAAKARARKNEAKGFREYLAELGAGDGGSARIMQDAKKELTLSDTRHGALGEALSGSGLFDGGYEEYLRSVNSANYAEERGRAEEAKMLAEGRSTGGYEGYLSEYDKMQSKISEAFINEMKSSDVYDLEKMFELATERGLSESNALYTAAAAIRKSSANATEKIINFAARYGLTPKQTANYAKTFGLRSYYVDKAENAVKQFAEVRYGGLSYSDYIEYIINKYSNK